jgi:hypothetical protein
MAWESPSGRASDLDMLAYLVLHIGDDLRLLCLAYGAEGSRGIGKITHFSLQ